MMLALTELGLLLIFLGFIVAFMGMALTILSGNRRGSKGKVGGGGLIMIGPIPILFGTDRKWVALMAIVAMAAIALYIMMMAGVKL